MPRYFFNIDDAGDLSRDEEGIELADLDAVREEALESAREILSEEVLAGRQADGRKFVITNEQGNVLLTYPFKKAMPSG